MHSNEKSFYRSYKLKRIIDFFTQSISSFVVIFFKCTNNFPTTKQGKFQSSHTLFNMSTLYLDVARAQNTRVKPLQKISLSWCWPALGWVE